MKWGKINATFKWNLDGFTYKVYIYTKKKKSYRSYSCAQQNQQLLHVNNFGALVIPRHARWNHRLQTSHSTQLVSRSSSFPGHHWFLDLLIHILRTLRFLPRFLFLLQFLLLRLMILQLHYFGKTLLKLLRLLNVTLFRLLEHLCWAGSLCCFNL